MRKWLTAFFRSDLAILMLLAVIRVALHSLSNGQYGFHRDELQTLDDARHLDWGFVVYPPITPLIGRLELTLFGISLVGFRFFAAVAVSTVMVLAGLITRELGGGRREQVLTAIAVAISPTSLTQGAVFQYVSFDYLWGVLVTYFLVRLLKSEDPRWWLAIGLEWSVGCCFRTHGDTCGVDGSGREPPFRCCSTCPTSSGRHSIISSRSISWLIFTPEMWGKDAHEASSGNNCSFASTWSPFRWRSLVCGST